MNKPPKRIHNQKSNPTSLSHYLRFLTWIGILFLFACSQHHKDLRNKIAQLSEAAQGTVGISIKLIETGDTLSFNGNELAVMQSVFKFPIALTILNQVIKAIFLWMKNYT